MNPTIRALHGLRRATTHARIARLAHAGGALRSTRTRGRRRHGLVGERAGRSEGEGGGNDQQRERTSETHEAMIAQCGLGRDEVREMTRPQMTRRGCFWRSGPHSDGHVALQQWVRGDRLAPVSTVVSVVAVRSGEKRELPVETVCMPIRGRLQRDDRIEVRTLDEHLARVQFTNERGDRSYFDDVLSLLGSARPGDVVLVDSGVPAVEPQMARCEYSLWTSVRVLPTR